MRSDPGEAGQARQRVRRRIRGVIYSDTTGARPGAYRRWASSPRDEEIEWLPFAPQGEGSRAWEPIWELEVGSNASRGAHAAALRRYLGGRFWGYPPSAARALATFDTVRTTVTGPATVVVA